MNGHTVIKEGSERSFSIVFAVVFFLITIQPLIGGETIRIWAAIATAITLGLGLFLPKTLTIPNKLWFKFGILLGAIVSPILMAIIFFVVVMPTGLIMKALGKDFLKNSFDKKAKSYWILRDKNPMGSMKNQF